MDKRAFCSDSGVWPARYHRSSWSWQKGRMIEMQGVKMEDDVVVIYHAMKLTQKMARELAL